jgi:beta-RFAP synthase
MGFIDLSGALGRHFGSIGMALNEITTRIHLTADGRKTVSGPSAERADRCLRHMCDALKVSDKVNIHVESAIPEHVGLGSGTQMALAIGSALNAYYRLGLSIRQIAALMDRGLRSGIGIGVFELGGLVVDGGRGVSTVLPPVLVQLDLPETWRFILVFDRRGQGLHGEQELAAFQSLPVFPRAEAEKFCYKLLMQALPAVAECDLERFGEVITELQYIVGMHFSPAQGGVYASPEVEKAMLWLQSKGAVAVGQTSWGPTGFCAVSNIATANQLIEQAKIQFQHSEYLDFMMVSANNLGQSHRINISDD